MSGDRLTQKAGSYETALGFHLPELSLLEVTLLQVHPAAPQRIQLAHEAVY